MPKKKEKTSKKFHRVADFTINDSANASKCGDKIKKSVCTVPAPEDLSWDQIDDDLDIVEEVNEDGTKTFVYKKKKHPKQDDMDARPGIVYPEIVWYMIARFIRPEDVGRFAAINKATYAITKRESFWTSLYKDYCQGHPKLPYRLRLENSFRVYGLRQRVIRSLHHTYDVFFKREDPECRPHRLVKSRCVNIWFDKGPSLWTIFFKFRKQSAIRKLLSSSTNDFVEELGKLDANPEEDSQVLKVVCRSFYQGPPLMGMVLTSLKVALARGLRHYQMHMGFNTGHHVSRDVVPECTVILDKVVTVFVLNWWDPRYPHFDNQLPSKFTDESTDSLTVLKNDFFTTSEIDL
ncbi:putative transmembrane protein 183BP [Ostrinia nubilalis]|uniref:putative transmembrane protein 183BP n=1 Tax=Ostrinia nubilalis TaxID=29057 RepID=UPI00308225D4